MPERRSTTLPLLAFVSSIVVLLVVNRVPQDLFSDPAWQLTSLQQYLAGESPSFNKVVQPNPRDISTDSSEWVSWWPIGTNLLCYPLLRAGLSLGDAVRSIAALALLMGSIGFGWWSSRFRIPRWMAITLAVGIPWLRNANLGLFSYQADALVYGIAPWLALVTFHLAARWESLPQSPSAMRAFGAGLLLGSAYWLKYSGVFISLGAIVYLSSCAWNRRQRIAVLIEFTLVFTAFAAMIAGLNLLNRSMGAAMNNVTEAFSVQLDWRLLPNVVGLVAMAMADADGLWRYLLFHPDRPLLPFSYTSLCLIGLPGGLVLLWLLFRPTGERALVLARTIGCTTLAAFALVTIVYDARAYEGRYVAAIGILLMPAALESAYRSWPTASRFMRSILAATGLFYLAVPLAYGACAVAIKLKRTSHYTAGRSGLYNPLLAERNVPAVVNELTAGWSPAMDIWYLTDPVAALDLPGRAIIRPADYLDGDALRREEYRTLAARNIKLLLPTEFDGNGKAEIIKGSFRGSGEWHRATVVGARVLWTASIGP